MTLQMGNVTKEQMFVKVVQPLFSCSDGSAHILTVRKIIGSDLSGSCRK